MKKRGGIKIPPLLCFIKLANKKGSWARSPAAFWLSKISVLIEHYLPGKDAVVKPDFSGKHAVWQLSPLEHISAVVNVFL